MIRWRSQKYRKEGNDKISRIIIKSSHNHLDGIREVIAMEVVEEQLQNDSKNPTVPPRRVMLDISNKLHNIHCNLTSSEGSIRRVIQRRRQISGDLPPLPLSFEDLNQLIPQSLKVQKTHQIKVSAS
ncbi:unnamed protein product [Lepeophtheirus salmonis]|uniref:(salmon louse) hypothetical protein n=1 Tax=Lepeophtheirus salmonis TaxID=72036 RepID=A0A7R8H4V3_LEPSM|nr:unnamed protein product [Lepeophtheirus salmonis]CAF2866482.1 unnamed protein product [Lepeophtheirus salmonis]